MSEEKEKDKIGEENSNAAEVIKELGLLTTGDRGERIFDADWPFS